MGVVGNNSGTDSRQISRDLTLRKLRNIHFLVIFSILGGGPRNVNDLPTSPINQFQDHSHRNRIEKLVPVNYRFPTDSQKTLTNIDQTVFKPWLFAEIWVSKNPGLVSGSHPGGLYFQKWHKKQTKLDMPENVKKRHLFLQNSYLFLYLFMTI